MNYSEASSDNEHLHTGLLTIGIPVFTEEDGLAQSLASISQLKEFESGVVEVVVWDNCSTDLSYKVASDFALASPRTVRVGRNGSNIGPMKNLIQVLRNSTSKFVWILGAGEEVLPTSIAPLISYLNDCQNSTISMGVVTAEARPTVQKHADYNWAIKTLEPETLSCFVETISLSIVSRALALAVLEGEDSRNQDKFRVWPHLEVALAATSQRTFAVSLPPMVRVSENPSGWWYHSKDSLGIYLNQVKLLKGHPRAVPWVQHRLNDRTGWHFAKFAFEIKVEGAGLMAGDLIEARKAGIQSGPLLVALAVALCPKALLRVVQWAFRWLRRK